MEVLFWIVCVSMLIGFGLHSFSESHEGGLAGGADACYGLG